MRCDVLIFAEDPGAANYTMHLSAALKARNKSATLIATGHAVNYFTQHGISTVTTLKGNETAQTIIDFYQPKVILVGNSENKQSLSFDLTKIAHAKKIKSIGVVDAYYNAAYRYRGNSDYPLTYSPDFLIVADEITKQAFVKLGYHTDHIYICGHPYYDEVLAKKMCLEQQGRKKIHKKLFPQLDDPDRLIITFGTETCTGAVLNEFQYSSEYSLRGWGRNTGRTFIVLEELISTLQELDVKPYLIIRLHPKNSKTEFKEYLSFFDCVSQFEPALDVIYISDIVIGMTSSFLFEAHLLGKKTLSILPRKCEMDWMPAIKTGIIPCATTSHEIHEKILDFIKNSSKERPTSTSIVNGALNNMVDIIERYLK